MKRVVCIFLLLWQLLMMAGCADPDNALVQTQSPETAPQQPAKQYMTVDGKELELLGARELTAGYTQENLVQFTDFYDFGLRDERPLGFSGQVYLDGNALEGNDFRFDGYPDLTTIVLKLYQGNQLTGNILTIPENSVIFYDRQAVVIETTFNAMWDGEKWIEEKHGG